MMPDPGPTVAMRDLLLEMLWDRLGAIAEAETDAEQASLARQLDELATLVSALPEQEGTGQPPR